MKRILLLTLWCVAATTFAQLPKVNVKDISGKAVCTDTLSNGGKPFIIDFFATWCKPCNRELDAIREVYEDWQAETGVKIFAVSIDEGQNINKVKPLVDAHSWEMIPYTLIVDGKGKIVYQHNGYTDGAEDELIEKVRELIQ